MQDKIRFIHIADLHLGYDQYNNLDRFRDFGRAFLHIVDSAIDKNVDFVVISGDIFNKRNINAATLSQATICLQKLKERGIDVVAIEGNHDKALFKDKMSWMNFLNKEGLISLLKPEFSEEGIVIEDFDKEKRKGAVYSFGNQVRVYGLPYMGVLTKKYVEKYSKIDFDQNKFNLMLLHSGFEGYIHESAGGLKLKDVEGLRGKMDYVALGHIHNNYEIDGWIYNPGSPETWSIDEFGKKKGYYFVEVDGKDKMVNLIENPRRKFYRFSLDISGETNENEVYSKVERFLVDKDVDKRSVVELTIRGTAKFDKFMIDVEAIEDMLKRFEPIVLKVYNQATSPDFELNVDYGLNEKDRTEFERDILKQLVDRQEMYKDKSDEISKIVLEIKDMCNSKAGTYDIISQMEKFLEVEDDKKGDENADQ